MLFATILDHFNSGIKSFADLDRAQPPVQSVEPALSNAMPHETKSIYSWPPRYTSIPLSIQAPHIDIKGTPAMCWHF